MCFASLRSGREGFVAILGSVVVVVLNRAASGCVWGERERERVCLPSREFCDKDLKLLEHIFGDILEGFGVVAGRSRVVSL